MVLALKVNSRLWPIDVHLYNPESHLAQNSSISTNTLHFLESSSLSEEDWHISGDLSGRG